MFSSSVKICLLRPYHLELCYAFLTSIFRGDHPRYFQESALSPGNTDPHTDSQDYSPNISLKNSPQNDV